MKKSKLFLINVLLVLFVCLGPNLKAQTLSTDSTLTQRVMVADSVEIHSPKKAALYSAILPGLGQAYNNKYWKIPFIYAGFGTIGYFIGWNNKNYGTLKQAYSDITDTDPNTNSYLDLEGSQYYDLESDSGKRDFKTALNKQQDYYRRNRDLLIIVMAGFYGLNIIDASVDAHLFDFDISDDLSFNWEPAMKSVDNQLVYGVNCSFSF